MHKGGRFLFLCGSIWTKKRIRPFVSCLGFRVFWTFFLCVRSSERERRHKSVFSSSTFFPKNTPPQKKSLSERRVKERRCARHVSRCRRAPDAREDDDEDDEEDEEEE